MKCCETIYGDPNCLEELVEVNEDYFICPRLHGRLVPAEKVKAAGPASRAANSTTNENTNPVRPPRTFAGKWSISTDEENYHGTFDTMEEAMEIGRQHGRTFFVGQCVEPTQPENLFDGDAVDDWLERTVYEHDDYAGEWAEGSIPSTGPQREELADEIRPIIAAWLDRHGLRPRHWNIDPASVRRIESKEQ